MIGKIADSIAFSDINFKEGKKYYYEYSFSVLSCCMTVLAVKNKNLDEV